MFLDDGLAGDKDFATALQCSKQVKLQLEDLAFLIAHKKSHWFPCQKLDWLGFTWDIKNGNIFVKEDRIEKLEKYLNFVLFQVTNGKILFRARFIASIVGKLISMHAVFGNVVRRNTRFIYDCVMSKASWQACGRITHEALSELMYWNLHCRNINTVGAKISTVTVNTLFDCEIFCDASDVGFGGYTTPFADSHFENFETFGNWTKPEMGESSTWRELECVRRVLKTFNVTENKQIKINSDNKNVEHILKVGSKKLKLQSIDTSIIDFCEVQKINLTPYWTPRTENNDADYLSRVMDHYDWGIEPSIYHYLCNLWEICTVDRFATHYNSQCERFNSKVWCPGTEAVDAFTQFWGNDVNWLVPPPILITKTLNK
ncbi:uncharacterized protein LOC134687850 [Mytilus trossulus]|uniref:uncharacterized protein LOC134687850 n=1 Tax=Mytilus trossulus TaxID=6551 RepID=UPI00300743E5